MTGCGGVGQGAATVANGRAVRSGAAAFSPALDESGITAARVADAATVGEASSELEKLESELADLERTSLFFGEYDDNAAIVSVHAGAGGVDAQDWAEMLLRMYTRYLETAGFQVEVDSSQETGGLYETGGRAWVIKPTAEDIPKKKYVPGEWTDLEVRAQGKQVTVKINGIVTAEVKNDPGRTEGLFVHRRC